MKASDMAVLAATQEPSTWHDDGTHAAAVLYDPRYEGQYLIRLAPDDHRPTAYRTAQQAGAALFTEWQAEDARRRQANRTARLDSLAQAAGFDTWRRLETAALAGECAIVAR